MNHRFLAWGLAIVCLLSLSIWFPRQEPLPQTDIQQTPNDKSQVVHAVDYDRDILPILSAKCFACHGPDARARKGKFRLDLREIATKPTRSGDTPIVPGKSAQSEVVRRVFANDESQRMPPMKGGKALTEGEKDLIKRWIDQGAGYKQHWAFTKLERPAIPSVKDKNWVRNEIDAFILHRLE